MIQPVEYGATNLKTFERSLLGDSEGRLWYPGLESANALTVLTTLSPRPKKTDELLSAIEVVLSEEFPLRIADQTLLPLSICGPVTHTPAGPKIVAMVNTGKEASAAIDSTRTQILNDAVAALLGSKLAGVAQNHKGCVAMITLGTGVGQAAIVRDPLCGKMQVIHIESHGFSVPGFGKTCGCNREGCIERSVSQSGLYDLLNSHNEDLPDGFFDQLTPAGIGYAIANLRQQDEYAEVTSEVLKEWHSRLAFSVSSLLNLDMGRDKSLPAPLIVIAGGLSTLVDTELLKESVLKLYDRKPFFGGHFEIVRETLPVNCSPLLGVSAFALACSLGLDPLQDISWGSPP